MHVFMILINIGSISGDRYFDLLNMTRIQLLVCMQNSSSIETRRGEVEGHGVDVGLGVGEEGGRRGEG